MAASDHEQTPERNVLADHHPQLGDLSVDEMLAELRLEGRVDRAEVRGEFLREPDGERFTGREAALRLRKMDLADGLFTESLTRRRRVSSEQSSIAVVERRDLEARELLDSGWDDSVLVTRPKKCEIALEEVGNQLR